MVERRADPTDRRVRRLHLLPASEPIIKEIAHYREGLDAEITEGLFGPAREALVDALLHIKMKLAAEPADIAKLAMAGE